MRSALACYVAGDFLHFRASIQDEGASARADQPEDGAGGDRLHLEAESRAWIDFAGFVCGAAGRRGGAAARYAREILHTGPWGLGILRSAPGVGAARWRFCWHTGRCGGRVGATMLWCVAAFGVFHHCVWDFAQPDPFVDCAGAGGSRGHGQRGDSRDAGAGGDAG